MSKCAHGPADLKSMNSMSAPTEVTTPVGPRLAPDARRRHLLGVARSFVEDHGVTTLSLEGVANAAGVSRALLYNYFGNRAGLIQALWDQVAPVWDMQPMAPYESMLESSSLRELFDEQLERSTCWYLDLIEDSGLLLHRLLSEPTIEASIVQVRKRVETNNTEWWARLVVAMGVDPEKAQVFSTLINSSVQSMWGVVARSEAPRDVIEELFYLSCRSTLDALLAERGN